MLSAQCFETDIVNRPHFSQQALFELFIVFGMKAVQILRYAENIAVALRAFIEHGAEHGRKFFFGGAGNRRREQGV